MRDGKHDPGLHASLDELRRWPIRLYGSRDGWQGQ